MLTDDGAQKTQPTCIGSILEESENYKKRFCKRFYKISNFFSALQKWWDLTFWKLKSLGIIRGDGLLGEKKTIL